LSHFTTGMTWLNEPPHWAVRDGDLVVRSGTKTDFWQRTHYGFRRDNGHFLHRQWSGDFTTATSFTGAYETLYDQAGMMLRAGAEHWIKCGIEYTGGAMHLSVVVTNVHSDWSVQRIATTALPIGVRMTRLGDACFVQFRVGDDPWHMARLAWFPPEPAAVMVGLAFCSPEREGFEARYQGFEIGPPATSDFH
jgi:hypothetical protein